MGSKGAELAGFDLDAEGLGRTGYIHLLQGQFFGDLPLASYRVSLLVRVDGDLPANFSR